MSVSSEVQGEKAERRTARRGVGPQVASLVPPTLREPHAASQHLPYLRFPHRPAHHTWTSEGGLENRSRNLPCGDCSVGKSFGKFSRNVLTVEESQSELYLKEPVSSTSSSPSHPVWWWKVWPRRQRHQKLCRRCPCQVWENLLPPWFSFWFSFKIEQRPSSGTQFVPAQSSQFSHPLTHSPPFPPRHPGIHSAFSHGTKLSWSFWAGEMAQ